MMLMDVDGRLRLQKSMVGASIGFGNCLLAAPPCRWHFGSPSSAAHANHAASWECMDGEGLQMASGFMGVHHGPPQSTACLMSISRAE